MSSKDKKHNRYIKIHSTKLLIRFSLNEISVWNFNITFILPYIFTVATFYCVNIDLKLAITINVRRYFDSSKITGETTGRAFLFYFLTTMWDINAIQRGVLWIIIICELLLFIWIFI